MGPNRATPTKVRSDIGNVKNAGVMALRSPDFQALTSSIDQQMAIRVIAAAKTPHATCRDVMITKRHARKAAINCKITESAKRPNCIRLLFYKVSKKPHRVFTLRVINKRLM
jgi:hypothetical protein